MAKYFFIALEYRPFTSSPNVNEGASSIPDLLTGSCDLSRRKNNPTTIFLTMVAINTANSVRLQNSIPGRADTLALPVGQGRGGTAPANPTELNY